MPKSPMQDFPEIFVSTSETATAVSRAVSQGLDRAFGPPHGVVFQGMADAEQEQQQRAFRPGAESRRPRRRDQHQGVDLEAFTSKVLHRLTHSEEAAEPVGDDEER